VTQAARAAPLARKRRMRSTDKASVAELKAELAALAASDGRLHAALDAAAESYAGKPGRPRSFRDLHRLLERQSYRLAYWRTATDEINYRRFFDINDLAGLRVEDDAVFEQLHRLVLALIEGGRMTGLRLDHVDGLYDPAGYVERLQAEAARRLGCEESELPLYLLVEKILAPFERLPEGWAVHGTTGYDFMAQAAGLLVDPNGERPLTRLYTRLTGRPGDFDEVAAGSKRQILRNNLSAEFTVIARRLTRLAKRHWQTRDFTYPAIRAALSDFLTQFPVYRTYLAGGWTDEQGRRFLQWAYARAVREPGFLDGVRDKGARLMVRLREGLADNPRVRQVRGRGLMVGVALDRPARPWLELLFERGYLLTVAGGSTLRMTPPLSISEGELDEGARAVAEALAEEVG